MARMDDLEFVITANTTALRADLARGTDAVNAFASRTETALNRHQVSLEHISRSIRRVVELYGAVRAAEAFARQIEDATKLDKLTQDQADHLAGARAEVEKLGDAWEEMWRRAALKGAGFWETVARGARMTLEDISGGPSDRSGQLASIQQQIASSNSTIQFLTRTDDAGGLGKNASKIDFYRKKLDELWEEFKKLQAGASDADKTLGQLDWERKLSALQEITVGDHSKSILGPGPLGGLSNDMLTRAAQLAEQLNTPLEKDLETLQEIRKLMDAGALKSDAVNRFADQKLQEIDLSEITGKFKDFKPAIDDAEKSAKKFGDTMAASLESRGVEALVNGDVEGAIKGLIQDFVEMIVKLTVLKPLADSLTESFEKMGKTKGFASLLGGLFGGGGPTDIGTSADTNIYPGAGPADLYPGFASGGRPNVGQPAWFGEDGPELWVPDVAGRVLSNAESRSLMGGPGVTINQNNQIGLPPQWQVALAEATRIASIAASEAVMKQKSGKR